MACTKETAEPADGFLKDSNVSSYRHLVNYQRPSQHQPFASRFTLLIAYAKVPGITLLFKRVGNVQAGLVSIPNDDLQDQIGTVIPKSIT